MTYPATMPLKITINGVDRTADIPPTADELGLPGIAIVQEIGSAVDTASFTLYNGAALNLPGLSTVIISDPSGGTIYFGGLIVHTDPKSFGPDTHLVCQASDFTIQLRKALITKEYDASTADTAVLTDIRSQSLPPLTEFDFSTCVKAVGAVPKLRLNRAMVGDALDELATRVGAQWYVDYQKRLHWFSAEDINAPFGISDTPNEPSTFAADSLSVSADYNALVNWVQLVGGTYLSDNATDYVAGTGQSKILALAKQWHAPTGQTSIQCWRNDGTVGSPSWTTLTVKIANIDELVGANDILYDFENKTLEAMSAWPNLANALKITGQFEVPLRVEDRSDNSYAKYGHWYVELLQDTSITSKDEAHQRCLAELMDAADGAITASFSVQQPGLRVGQKIHIKNVGQAVDSDYIINRLTIAFNGGGYANFNGEAGDYLPDLAAMLRELKRQATTSEVWLDTEVLDSLLTWIENLPVAEGTPTVTTSSAPYLWGSFNWGFAKWGT